MLRRPLARGAVVFLIILGVTVALRAPAFGHSVIDWDESVYALVARSVLDGHLPYTEVWDHKQPFLYVLFAGAFLLLGQSVLAIRLLGCVAVASTAFVLLSLARRLDGGRWPAGVFAAGGYLLFSVSSGGLATNTELVLAPFAAGAFALLLPHVEQVSSRRCLAVGLLLGLAVQVKLIALFDAAAAVSIIGLSALVWGGTERWWVLLKRWTMYGLGLLAPLAAVLVVFTAGGALAQYWASNVTFNLTYSGGAGLPFGRLLAVIGSAAIDGAPVWFGAAIAAVLLVSRSFWPTERCLPLAAVAVWAVSGVVGSAAGGRAFGHYFLQPLAPLALLTGLLFGELWYRFAHRPRALRVVVVIVLLLPQLVSVAQSHARLLARPDLPAAVADHIEASLEPGETIFVANYQPIVYLLADARLPTPYVLPAWLVRSGFRAALGVDLQSELDRIFASDPAWVVILTSRPGAADEAFVRRVRERHLRRSYRLDGRVAVVELWRRSDPSTVRP